MDGNGRWARKRNLPRVMGHRSGVKNVDLIVKECSDKGVKALTLYTFSSENWKRSKEEVSALMKLLERSLREKEDLLREGNMRFNVIGRIDAFPESLQAAIKKITKSTSNNSGMVLTLALNYGARREILDAVKKVCEKNKNGQLEVSSLKEDDFEKFLYTEGLPPLDFIIRTSGEMRLSNFLLWQSAYAEIYVTKTLWPDFNEEDLRKALEEYSLRERRFGE